MAKKLPDGWRTTYCAFIAEGYTHQDAADATRVAAGTIRRHLHEDPELRELYAEAREQVRDKVRNRVWKLGMVEPEDSQTTRWALDHLIKWNLPEARETQKIELAGQVAIQHERRLTLDDLFAYAAAQGLVQSVSGELPGAPELLPAPADD